MAQNSHVSSSPVALLRLVAVKERTGLSRSELYSRIKLGSFPAPIKLGARAVAWISTEIDEWIADRIAERDVGPTKPTPAQDQSAVLPTSDGPSKGQHNGSGHAA